MKIAKCFLSVLLLAGMLAFTGCDSLVSQPKTYTVTYNANGADGGTVPASVSYEKGSIVSIAHNTGNLTKAGYNFSGWNTKPDGTGLDYSINSHIYSIENDITLYAKWTDIPTYTVTYNANGADSGTVPVDTEQYEAGSSVTVKDNTGNLAREGYYFVGWKTETFKMNVDYESGDSFTITKNMTLYAHWSLSPTYTLTYNKNGAATGTVPDSVTRPENSIVTVAGNTGYLDKYEEKFSKWNTEANGSGTDYEAGDAITITGNTTLYAQWALKPTYIITYNTNGADGGTVPLDTTNYPEGASVTVKGNTGNLTKDGHYFSHWNTLSNGTGTNYEAGDSIIITQNITLYAQWEAGMMFWAQKVTNNQFYRIGAELLSEGDHCLIYADKELSFSAADAESIKNEYENNIYSKITNAFGAFEDFDENGKVIILLLDIIDGYSGGDEGYVAGYFDPVNMFSKSLNSYSNEADMLYIDVNPGWNSTYYQENLYTTVAHELQHGVNYSRRVSGKPPQDEWINEGLSAAAEYIYGGSQNSRLAYFNADPIGSIGHGNNFFIWHGFWEYEVGDQLANYSTVYLFFQWLRVHASNDTEIYTDIINSSYGNYRAVTAAAGSRIDSQFTDWTTLLSTWMWANIKNESTGFKGYKNNSDLQPIWYPINLYYTTPMRPQPTSWSLFPGEGLFSLNLSGNTFNPVSTTYVKYINELCRPIFIDHTTNPPSGNFNVWLTVNVDTAKDGQDQEGRVAVSIRDDLSRNAVSRFDNVRTTAAVPHAYPISFADKQTELKARENQGKRKTAADARMYKR